MRSDEVGMDTKKVQINVKKMIDQISIESRIESSISNINERFKSAYSSNCSSRMNTNSSNIVKSLHSKVNNLRSYKIYTERYINRYTNASSKAVDLAKKSSSKLQ